MVGGNLYTSIINCMLFGVSLLFVKEYIDLTLFKICSYSNFHLLFDVVQ